MRKLLLLTALLAALATPAMAEEDITININGEEIFSEQPPIVINYRTYVPVRVVCENLGLDVLWNGDDQTVTISNDKTSVLIGIDQYHIEINGKIKYTDSAPQIINSTTCVPIRAVVEPFGASVIWDAATRRVIIDVPTDEPEAEIQQPPAESTGGSISSGTSKPATPDNEENVTPPSVQSKPTQKPTSKPEPEDKPVQKPEVEDVPEIEEKPASKPDIEDEPEAEDKPVIADDEFYFFAQSDEEWGFASNGRGYCWVCSYAMLISNILDERITPVEIEQYNLDAGSSSGNYMANHFNLAKKYNLKFVPAIDESSEYFDRFDSSHRGATYFKAETDEDVKNALIEALEQNPDGIMVRFEGYPHTLVATEYKNGEIYFNDPGTLTMEDVTFENTVLGKRFVLTDLTFVQAMEKK